MKRKISEMDADELAHLCLKLQDRVQSLRATVETTEKQLTVVKHLYRKKSKIHHQLHPWCPKYKY